MGSRIFKVVAVCFDCLGPFLRPLVIDHHRSPFCREPQGDRPADPTGRPGNYGRLSVQTPVFIFVFILHKSCTILSLSEICLISRQTDPQARRSEPLSSVQHFTAFPDPPRTRY